MRVFWGITLIIVGVLLAGADVLVVVGNLLLTHQSGPVVPSVVVLPFGGSVALSGFLLLTVRNG